MSEAKILYLRYWKKCDEYLERTKSTIRVLKPEQPSGRLFVPVRVGVKILGTISMQKKRACVEVLLENPRNPDNNRKFFEAMQNKENAIEKELGFKLLWMPVGYKPTSADPRARITLYEDGFDPKDESDWQRHFAWFKEKAEAFDRVFTERLRNI